MKKILFAAVLFTMNVSAMDGWAPVLVGGLGSCVENCPGATGVCIEGCG